MTTKKRTTKTRPRVLPWEQDPAAYLAEVHTAMLDVVITGGLRKAAGFYRQHRPGRAQWELARLRLKVERLEAGYPAIDQVADLPVYVESTTPTGARS